MESLTALGMGALLVRVGLAVYLTGVVRSKHSASAVARALAELCITTLAFALIGAAFLDAPSGFIGIQSSFLLGGSPAPDAMFLQLAAMLTATSVVCGATAERSRFGQVVWSSLLLGGIVLPITGNWIWRGWLRQAGFIDVAGAAAFQLPAALCALIAAATVGPRSGKYHRDGSSSMIPGHSLPLAAIGAVLFVVGWIACAAGCCVLHQERFDQAAIEVLFAAATAGVSAMAYCHFRYRKIDVLLLVLGILGGTVAGSAGAGVIGPRAALLVGAVAGLLVPWAAVWFDLYLRIDDPSGLIAAQGIGAVCGTLAVALFLPGPVSTRLHHLAIQALGLASAAILSLLLSGILYFLLKAIVGVRSREADEFDGLDLAYHDVGAYPDFQQNMIRSYHLREA